MIVVAARFTGKPERRADIARLTGSIASSSRTEAGCISYAFYEQLPNTGEYLCFEEWADQAALEAHFKTAHFQDFAKQFPELTQGQPKLRTYEVGKIRDL